MTLQSRLQDYEKDLATQIWENISPFMHPDICVTFSDGTYKGIKAVEAAFRKTFDLIKDETYTISNTHWLRSDENFAVCIYNFYWSGLINGQQANGGGRGTTVFINENGVWLILTEHLGPEAIGKS